jgi:hypothetical protein
MNAAAKHVMVLVVQCLSIGLLTVSSISCANADAVTNKRSDEVVMALDRFSRTPDFCKAFLGIQDVGTDGLSAEYAVALDSLIHANKDDVASTVSMLRKQCCATVC